MFLKHFWPAISWIIVILLLAGLPGSTFPVVPELWGWLKPDKLVHIIQYAVLVFLFTRGIQKQNPQKKLHKPVIFYILAAGVTIGAITELLQFFLFRERNGDVYDFMANITGCCIGLVVFIFNPLKKIKKK